MIKSNKKDSAKWIRYLYLIGLFYVFILILAIMITRKPTTEFDRLDDYITIDDVWTLSESGEGETSVELKNLGQYFDKDSDTLSIYWKIPKMKYDRSLIYRSKDVYTQVLVDGEDFYSTEYYDSPFYTKSPGNNWNIVTIPSKYEGKTIEMRITYAYDTSAVSVDHFYWGNKSDVILSFFIDKSLPLLLSLFIIIIGVVLIFMNQSSFGRSEKNGLLYLGIYAVLMGSWSLLETNVLQFFVKDGRILQLSDNLLMITDSLPLIFYLDEEFDILKRKPVKYLCILDIAYIFLCVLGQISGFVDAHYMLIGSWLATVLSFVLLLYILIKQVWKLIHGEKLKKSVTIQLSGFVSLMVLVIVSMPIYLKTDGMDRAESIRFGMLIMIILFSVAGQLQTYELILQGTRYSIVKDLAYHDGLTGLRNRTSYLEKLDTYRDTPPEHLGMIFFDVNNLKQANDNYGHDLGDKLIRTAANIIKESFSKKGKAYRTGGDEFIVFLAGDNPQKDYEEGKKLFEKAISEVNSRKEFPFEFQIAHGFAMREEISEMHLQLMIANADANMYENKRMLKGE